MIRRIFVSETDRNNLSKCKTREDASTDKFNYTNIIVKKPWGLEYLMYENDYVAIWILHLKKNHSTSMHCHTRKKTSLVLLSGKVTVSTLSEWFELTSLDGLIFEEGVFHASKALTPGAIVMEIESPPNKRDLVRLIDVYGREDKGYEGKDKFIKNLKNFKNIFFNKEDITDNKKRINNVLLSIKKCRSNYLRDEIDFDNMKKIYSILEEKIIESKHKSLFAVGNIFNFNDIKDQKDIRLFNNCLLLKLERSQ